MPAVHATGSQKTGERRRATDYRPETSRDLKDGMVGLMGRILNGGVDVLPFEEGVIGENLVETCAAGQKLKNVGYTNALPTNAGAASAFAFFDGYSLESSGAHIEVPANCPD